jgi:hypothetical protein
LFSIGKIRVSSNEERGLKIPRKYIASEVNGTRVVNSLLDYSARASSVPVHGIVISCAVWYNKTFIDWILG